MSEHIFINGHKHVSHQHESYDVDTMKNRSKEFYKWLNSRRSVREYSDKEVSKEVIENIMMSASTAPSGAHKQPWTFCAISSAEIKSKIRAAAEAEEKETYSKRMSDRWRKDLEPLGTDDNKPFLEIAPWLIVVFKRVYEHENGEKHNNYYVNESVGIASGMLISAIHNAGLVTLTHTPSPMNFLTKVLERPSNERPFLLLPVGYPKEPIYVPNIDRKGLDEISVFYE
ncbi:nitroreductase family protein [Urechidicola vernalis]|uniref:Nitroreductase family protein n=1 Tax=Urechidicola vernalis TaxID=3075600 RepID=A0ABU2Y710_9FLAO|nr:nitroreductase family protein [Urechidicola sp. P050]MDT0553827.1 nitroreductase family protein [Urechidicola sp. P050]